MTIRGVTDKPRAAAPYGAFMEQSDRNQRQPVANGEPPKTAQTGRRKHVRSFGAILDGDRWPQPGDRCKMSVLNPLKSSG
jgi:hypothetical protein